MARTSRTSTPAAEPVTIPNPHTHPDVVKATDRHDAVAAELADVRRGREATERELGVRPGDAEHEIEGRLIALGEPPDLVGHLREYRHREKALSHALGLLAADVKAATDRAAREYAAEARDKVFAPAARKAVAVWLAACQEVQKFHLLVDQLRATGVGSGLVNPLAGPVPVCLADWSWFEAFARELVQGGFIDADAVNAAFPDVM